ncbi:unnamed protein product [Mytilus edulis]|uniref:B box-type domain-containing protein n=1 Tax=Mytilus edulis TaxID=6550 RepID=A0A8S3U731_MYTED|nr:unnamed protein product [Mytilus edulis]
MATLMALSTRDKTQECHACKRSNEKSNAKFWCKICEEALCEKCNQMHSRMKLSYTHDVVEIEKYSRNETGIDLNGISKQCNMHPSKEIEMFCSLHREPCCILCLVNKHFGCTGVKSIEEILNADNNYESLPAKLKKLKDATVILLRDKEKHKSEFTANNENAEEEAAKFMKLVKDNLNGSNITCGTSISVEYLVLGDEAEKKLHLLKNGTLINSTAFTGNPKRLCYDYCYSRVFISCHTRELYGASCLIFRNEIMKPEKIKFVKEIVGSIFSDNQNIFLVVNNAIKQFPNSLEGQLTTSFATNTTCELNGMDILENNIIFTTKDKEIKRANLNGKDIFCYKNETIKIPSAWLFYHLDWSCLSIDITEGRYMYCPLTVKSTGHYFQILKNRKS